jgi:hypothetical protein
MRAAYMADASVFVRRPLAHRRYTSLKTGVRTPVVIDTGLVRLGQEFFDTGGQVHAVCCTYCIL